MENPVVKTLKALKSNNFEAIYAEDKKIAGERILELIPKGSTVGIGDSVSVRQLQILNTLQEEGRILINPFSKKMSSMANMGEITKNQWRKIAKLALTCEYFLTGTNSLTEDGKLVNIDGAGNRVAGMIFGPEKVVVVVGRNKIVKGVDEAFYQIRNVIAPQHAKTKIRKTPCAHTGKCTDCSSKERICNVSTIIEKKPSYTNLAVIIVDQDLGLGWDEGWSEEHIERIYSSYSEFTWLKRPAWFD